MNLEEVLYLQTDFIFIPYSSSFVMYVSFAFRSLSLFVICFIVLCCTAGRGLYRDEFVTCGGVALNEVGP